VHEIIALEEQRLAGCPRQSIGEAVTEIEPRRMSAAFAEIPVGVTRDPCLSLGHRFDDKLRLPHEILKASAGNRITARIDDDRGFDEVGCRNAATGRGLDRCCTGWRLGLVARPLARKALT